MAKNLKNMKKTLTFAVSLAAAMSASLAVIQTAQAQSSSNTLANLAPNEVSSGLTLIIGDKTFSDFSYTDSGLTGFNPTQVTVTASETSGTYYLTWQGTFEAANAIGDLDLGYTVTASGGLINEIDLSYGGQLVSGTGLIGVTELAQDPSANTLGDIQLSSSVSSAGQFAKSGTFNFSSPEPVVDVTKDISFIAPGGTIELLQVEQSFEQVPEPTTISLLLLPFAASTLRILRKSRTV